MNRLIKILFINSIFISFLFSNELKTETSYEKQIYLTKMMIDLKRYDRALFEVSEAIRLEPNSSLAYKLRGDIFNKLQIPEYAKKSWQTAKELEMRSRK